MIFFLPMVERVWHAVTVSTGYDSQSASQSVNQSVSQSVSQSIN